MRFLATEGALPRVSWGAVFAGVILSLITSLILSVLGTAIGASVFFPMSRPDPLEGFGVGSGVYLIIMTVIAVFIGSYFAGRCAPVLGWLHGLLAWAVMVLMIAYGATSLVGGAVSAAGSAAATGATAGAVANPPGTTGATAGSLTQQLQGAVGSAVAEATSPEAQADARRAADTAAEGVARASWFSLAALLIGAIIAIASGHTGFKHQPPIEAASRVSSEDASLRQDSRVAPGRPIH